MNNTLDQLCPRTLRQRLDEGGRGLTLVDVRSPAEYRGSHVTGAVNIPLDTLTPERLAELRGEDGDVVFLCGTGARSNLACQRALEAGWPAVREVEGGTEACVAAGLDITAGRGVVSLERQVRIAAGTLVLAGAIASLFVRGFIAVPIFVGAGLVFAGVTNTCGMGMLLARMPWNR